MIIVSISLPNTTFINEGKVASGVWSYFAQYFDFLYNVYICPFSTKAENAQTIETKSAYFLTFMQETFFKKI